MNFATLDEPRSAARASQSFFLFVVPSLASRARGEEHRAVATRARLQAIRDRESRPRSSANGHLEGGASRLVLLRGRGGALRLVSRTHAGQCELGRDPYFACHRRRIGTVYARAPVPSSSCHPRVSRSVSRRFRLSRSAREGPERVG